MRNMVGYIIMFCTDAAFCYICVKTEWEKYKASTKHEPGKMLQPSRNDLARLSCIMCTFLQEKVLNSFLDFVGSCRNPAGIL